MRIINIYITDLVALCKSACSFELAEPAPMTSIIAQGLGFGGIERDSYREKIFVRELPRDTLW